MFDGNRYHSRVYTAHVNRNKLYRADSVKIKIRVGHGFNKKQSMSEERIIELEIKQAYQEDLIQALNQVVADQQNRIGKLEETCKLLHDKIKILAAADRTLTSIDERPPHY